jgi:hypothetical protein
VRQEFSVSAHCTCPKSKFHHDTKVSDTNNSNAHTRQHVEADRYRHLRQGRVHQGHRHRPQCLQGQFHAAFRNSRLEQNSSRRKGCDTQMLSAGRGAMEDELHYCIASATAGQKLTPHTGTYPPGYRPRGPHWHEQEPPPAIRCVRLLARSAIALSNTVAAPRRLVTRPLPNPGVPVVPSPVFLVSLEEELTVPVRLPSVTCAAPVACSLPPRSGASGTRRST